MERAAELLLAASGAWVILRLAQLWRGPLRWREKGLLLLVPVLFFGGGLAGGGSQADLDYVYQFPPYRPAGGPAPVVRNRLLTDIPLQVLPFRHLVREHFRGGTWPHWAHELGTGQPLAGNATSAPLAPAQVASLLLPPERGLPIAAGWHQLIAALGAFLLARALGVSRAGALVAAYAFSASLFQTVWAEYPLAMTTAWLPLAILAARDAVRGERGGALASSLVLASCALEGHPVEFAQIVLATAGAALLALPRSGWRPAIRGLARFAGSVALAGLVAMPALGPVFESFGESERRLYMAAGVSSAPAPLDFRQFVYVLDPFHAGSPRDGNWTGADNFSERATLFAGLFPLAAMLVGWSRAGRLRRLTLLAAAMLAIQLLLPLWFFLVGGLPLLPHVVSLRIRVLWVLATALLAGCVTEAATEPAVRKRIGVALLLVGLATAARGVAVEAPAPQRLWRIGAGGAAAATGALALAATAPVALALALPALTLLDAALAGVRFNPLDPQHAGLETPPALRELQRRLAAEGGRARSTAIGAVLPGYLPALHGLLDPRGWDPLRPAEALQLLRARLHRPALRGQLQQRATLDRGLHRFLGIRYVLALGDRDPGPPWERTLTVGELTLWRNPEARPLVFLPENLTYLPRDEISARLAKGAWPESVLVEGTEVGERAQQGEVLAWELTANGFSGEARLAQPGIVATSLTWMPGWSVRTDRGALRTRKVNGGFLGFELPAGSHRFVAQYRPRGWLLFVALGGVGLLLLGGSIVAAVRRRASPAPYCR